MGEESYQYGVQNTKNPLTGQPYLLSCDFKTDLPFSKVDDEVTRNKIINAQNPTDNIWGCRGTYHFYDGKTRLLIDIHTRPEATKDMDKIYQQLNEKLKSHLLNHNHL